MSTLARNTRRHVDDLRGASRLAIEATQGVTELVEAMHRNIASGPGLLGRPLGRPTRFFTRLIYGSIRRVAGAVGAGIDASLARLAPLLGESAPGPEREAVLAVLNGVLGDYLAETSNPLAIPMRFRHGGHPLRLERAALAATFPRAGARLLLLLHGSSMNDGQWNRQGRDYGAELSRELGSTAVYLHYNSGLHVSTNGRELAALLERLAARWPAPLEEIAIVAHSMGGLVARSACRFAEQGGLAWREKLRKLVCLGSPHHGAPLERGGSWVDLLLTLSPSTAPLARLGRIRSAGVTDLRFGNVLDEHWLGRDRFAHGRDLRTPLPLPVGVDCYAVAGTTSAAGDGKLRSDGLVPVDSALGRHPSAALTLAFPEAHRWISYRTGHRALLGNPDVQARIASWLRS